MLSSLCLVKIWDPFPKIPYCTFSAFLKIVMYHVYIDRSMDICNVCSKPTIKKCGKCGLARYCRTECQRSDWKNHKKICKYPFEIKESEGKGLGLFATRNLEIGDLIVCQDPVLFLKSGNEGIMRNSHEFRTEYEKLERRKKDQVLALAGNESNATPAVMAMERSLDFLSINEEWYPKK